jgi:hypothetical protein
MKLGTGKGGGTRGQADVDSLILSLLRKTFRSRFSPKSEELWFLEKG